MISMIRRLAVTVRCASCKYSVGTLMQRAWRVAKKAGLAPQPWFLPNPRERYRRICLPFELALDNPAPPAAEPT